jgi:glycosyltransferase involved in cell wall biosynthesis
MAKRLWRIPVVSKSLRGGILGDLTRLIKKPSGRRRFDMLQKYVDAFIAISTEIKYELLEHGVSPERCFFIPNGVNLDKFQPVAPSLRNELRKQLRLPEGLLVIYVGRLELEKRVDELIRVWMEIQSQYPNAYLLILGTGSREDSLKKMAAGNSNIIFRGAVDNVAAYLQTSDLFVLPSVAEGLSNALLEALATGVPVVVTATGGTTDIVRHKISGWLIDDYSPQNLLEGIQTFLNDESLRKDCGLEGRRFVLENYALRNTADNLCKLYNSL